MSLVFVNRRTQDDNGVTSNTLAKAGLATPAPEGNEISVFVHLPYVGMLGAGDKNGTLLKPLLFINGKVTTEVVGDDVLCKGKRPNAK